MQEIRLVLRMNDKEKKTLAKFARNNGMSMSDYVRYRLFENNPELVDTKHIYESPGKDKHNFYTMGTLYDIYFLLRYLISNQLDSDTFKEISNECRELAKNKINQYGYLKIRTKDE
ncbi:hypothetical protein H1Q59_05540 [Holosporaceae bacterium 'Namur']|nr:hypothetical protein [Holosporaceae bacterium 'Namur']